ncbi:MAG TPA: phosphatidate cytidylyltransferase, partial [Gammaproteobacteria bacterium]|nr:phosphatidate cytidylyltransferase [Gammaproteobacteria bacterium]
MLKLRIITAVVLLVLVLATVLLGPRWLLLALLGVGILAAAYEWSQLAGFEHWLARLVYGVSVLVLALLGWWWTQQFIGGIQTILLAALLVWLTAFVLIILHPNVPRSVIAGGGVFVMAVAWLAAVALYDLPRGKFWLLLVLALVWAADI